MEAQPFMPPQSGQAGWGASTDQVIPRFYRDTKYMPAQSEAEGRPVFKPMDMVEIRQAGEMDSLKEEVHNGHRMRWPQQWDAYEKGREQIVAGTPLIELFPGFPEVIAQLKASNIHTIEGLVSCPDSASTVAHIPFLGEWKKKAKEYVARTSKSATFTEMEKRFNAVAAEKSALEQRLAALEAKLGEKEAA